MSEIRPIPYYGTEFLIDHDKFPLYIKIHLSNPIAYKVFFIPIVDGVIDNGQAILVDYFDYSEDFKKVIIGYGWDTGAAIMLC